MPDDTTKSKGQGISYPYHDASPAHTDGYIWPTVLRELAQHFAGSPGPRRVFDLGCGNGAFAAKLARHSYEPVGVDPSTEGIERGRLQQPWLSLHVGSAYDRLAEQYGTFPAVVSIEVVEHVYAPRDYARTLFELVEPGGIAIVSTPYHGYLKNLALAVTGRLDRHFSPLWDHGHIKFWSEQTLGTLLTEVGFRAVRFERVGRVRTFAKSMIAIAKK